MRLGRGLGLVLLVLLALVGFAGGFMSQLPASFVLKHVVDVKQPGLVMQAQGSIWQGQVDVSWQRQPAGQVGWSLAFWPLVAGQIKADLNWRYGGEKLTAQLQLDRQQAKIELAQSSLDLANLLPLGGHKVGFLKGLQGQLHLRDLVAVLPYNQVWLQAISGKIVLTDVSYMGVNIQQLDIVPQMENQTLRLALNAEQDGWHLQGETRLTPPNRYQGTLQLQAARADQLPDWGKMLLRQTSPTEARANFSGQW